MHPCRLAHAQATELADRLKDHVFHRTTYENQWIGTTGGYQYYLWYAEAIGPSPTALRIEELILLMYDWNLDWYIRQVWTQWNRQYAPDAKKDAKRRVILDYREEQLRHGRTQQIQATQAAAAKREAVRAAAATEHVIYNGIELSIIRAAIHTERRSGKSGTDVRILRTRTERGAGRTLLDPAHREGRHATITGG